MAILLLGEHDNAALNDATARTLSAALQIGSDVDILIAGENCAAIADEAAKLSGVRKVLLCENPLYAHMQAENMTARLLPLMAEYDAFLAPATANGKNIAPRLAARLDVQQISEITAVLAADSFERPIYAGNALQKVRSGQDKNVITVRTTAFTPAETGQSAPVERLEAGEDTGLASFVSEELSQSD
ncbi:MAG TPA: electron transfer flavoprotein subunit alpha/FixB family protein, partial [Rhizobiales bacterium]|nr:electron transfer flavoprotein subunit alpha/FixB family protein [Hyphomicrobiales bacterium]